MYAEILPMLLVKSDKKIVLAVLDGLGGTTAAEGKTELEAADTPNMDALAREGSCGLHYPVGYGITPGSAPGHLGLFGYNPIKHQIGRGILEAYGVDLPVKKGDVAVRGNFATMKNGLIIDRRAGRIPTEECRRLVAKITDHIKEIDGVSITMKTGKDYRFAVVFSGATLYDNILDADPQKAGLPPQPAKARDERSERTAEVVNKFIAKVTGILKDEPAANTVLIRGFANPPEIIPYERYGLRAVGIAVYPMYRGLAKLVGMDVPPVISESYEDEIELMKSLWDEYDYFFIHFKKVDSYGEDGDFEAKKKEIEKVDALIPRIMELKPDVIAITGDHSTPSLLKLHSWHPVPVLIKGPSTFRDDAVSFSERECNKGILGHIPAAAIMMYLLAESGRLRKFGA